MRSTVAIVALAACGTPQQAPSDVDARLATDAGVVVDDGGVLDGATDAEWVRRLRERLRGLMARPQPQ